MRFDKYLVCLLAFASMFLGWATPCLAQAYFDDGPQPQLQPKPQTTVTEGSGFTTKRIYGWERNLTVRDPNLSKWHWDPIVANQYNRRVVTVKPPLPGAPPEADKPGAPNVPNQMYKQHYVKPIHVALPFVNHGELSIVNNSNSDLNGKVLSKPQSNKVATAPKPTATYGGEYHTGSSVGAKAATTKVNGTLLHMSGKKAACGPDSPKFF